MSKGWMGDVLWVDLGAGTMQPEAIGEEVYRRFLGGYGLAAKLIFDRQPKGLPALDPGNIFAVMSGLLTGTKAVFNGRWMIAGKSPLTGGWNDSNGGGDFAPSIKASGYDGILFVGRSERPAYLLIDGTRTELVDAQDLWGAADAVETEEILKQRHGMHVRVIAIGRGGETSSHIAGVVNAGGRVAGRGGLGALMGSKNLKAVCLAGDHEVAVHDDRALWAATASFLEELLKDGDDFAGTLRALGTAGTTADSAGSSDSPVKNWRGIADVDFPSHMAAAISDYAVSQYEVQKYHCAGCPIGCGAICHVPGEPLLRATHRPEYETLCSFGTQLLSDDLVSIYRVNEMLNRAGIDTISCGVCLNWAYDAYEQGLITKEETGGLELNWGNADAAVELVRQIIAVEGFGATLRNGVKAAAETLGGEAARFAMHSGGQELPMHDCRLRTPSRIALGVAYESEPTPGRHTSMFYSWDQYLPEPGKPNALFGVQRWQSRFVVDSDGVEGLAEYQTGASCGADVVNGAGLCNFGFDLGPKLPLVEWLNAATGWASDGGRELDFNDYLEIGRRIKTVRHAFNIREGISPSQIRMPDRARGMAQEWDAIRKAYYRRMGWDPETAWPLPETLDELELPEVKRALYG